MKNKSGLTFGQRFRIFLKKNSFALAVTGCAILLVVALAVTAIVRTNQNNILDMEGGEEQQQQVNIPQEGNVSVDPPKQNIEAVTSDNILTFVMPLKDYTIGTDFVNDDMVYNKTLNEWSAHVGVDFVTQNPENVMATADGVVESVSYSTLDGTIIVIKHTDEIKSVYKSLAQDVEVVAGQEVKAGDIIGMTSTSASSEAGLGNHLHFEILENDVAVNPFDYIGDK